MGQSYSQPVTITPYNPNNYVFIGLRIHDNVHLIHAPPEVIQMMDRIVYEMTGRGGETGHNGCPRYRLSGSPFQNKAGKDNSTFGRKFVIRLFEEMYVLGYDFVASSDLAVMLDNSTLIFKKVSEERENCSVLCIAPGQFDRLNLVRCDFQVKEAILRAINDKWSPGLTKVESMNFYGEEIQELKLFGRPWAATGEASVECRLLIIEIIANLEKIGWKFMASTNIKAAQDAFFFIRKIGIEDNFMDNPMSNNRDLAVLSLNRTDRIRLINFDLDVADDVERVINEHYQKGHDLEKKDRHGAVEFKLKGRPFLCNRDKAAQTKELLCYIFETLATKGWECETSMDICRYTNHDKNIFIFKRCQRKTVKFACIAPTALTDLRFINFSDDILSRLQEMVRSSYIPGIRKETGKNPNRYKFRLKLTPWFKFIDYTLHGRSMMLQLLNQCEQMNWKLVTSADVSSTRVHRDKQPDYPLDPESWFLSYEPQFIN